VGETVDQEGSIWVLEAAQNLTMRFFQFVLRQAILTHALYVTDRLTTDPTDNKFRHEFELILIEETLLQYAVGFGRHLEIFKILQRSLFWAMRVPLPSSSAMGSN